MEKIKIILFSLLLLALFLILYKQKEAKICEWRITNCCPPEAGAKWECVDIRKFKEPNCSKYKVLCPQVISPKPNKLCVYENGRCVVK